MNVSYKGIKQEVPPKIQAKLDAKFAKLSKLLEKRGEREAHVMVRQERHLNRAEITVQFYDHQLVGEGADSDLFKAVSVALERIEKQAVNQRGKWREKHRREEAPAPAPEAAPAPCTAARNGAARRVYRPNAHERRKPITLDEAMLEMEKDRDYIVYRDADKESVSVLVRRRDGHFDLIET